MGETLTGGGGGAYVDGVDHAGPVAPLRCGVGPDDDGWSLTGVMTLPPVGAGEA